MGGGNRVKRIARAREAEARRAETIEAMGSEHAYWIWRLATQKPGTKERRKLERRLKEVEREG